LAGSSGQRQELLFSKKEAKNFLSLAFATYPTRRGRSLCTEIKKFFGSFFQKRTAFFLQSIALPGSRPTKL
jgi:hypothetical protein